MYFEEESAPALEEYYAMLDNFMQVNHIPILRQYGGQSHTIRGRHVWVEGPLGFSDSRTCKLHNVIMNFTGENERDFVHLMVLYNLECDTCRLHSWFTANEDNRERFIEFYESVYNRFSVESINIQNLLM